MKYWLARSHDRVHGLRAGLADAGSGIGAPPPGAEEQIIEKEVRGSPECKSVTVQEPRGTAARAP